MLTGCDGHIPPPTRQGWAMSQRTHPVPTQQSSVAAERFYEDAERFRHEIRYFDTTLTTKRRSKLIPSAARQATR